MRFFEQADWQSIDAFVGVCVVMLGFFGWFMRTTLARNFVSHADHLKIDERIARVEKSLAAMATKADFLGLEARLRPVETGVQVLSEQVRSVGEGVTRTERLVSILVEAGMKVGGGE